MRVLLIVCSPNKKNLHELLSTKVGELNYLDWQISKIRKMGYPVDVVLTSDYADSVLRQSRLIHDCDFVYDTENENSNFWTALRAGLHACHKECMVLPIDTPCPEANHWQKLWQHFYTKNNIDLARICYPKKGQVIESFPLVVASSAKSKILQCENFQSFDNLTLRKSLLPILGHSVNLHDNCAL